VAIFSNAGGILTTSQVFYTTTDSSNQVASFSSRGNVGIGIKGPYGRFKPDVMANGTFTVSTRSKLWDLTNTFPVNSPFYPPLNVLNTALAPDYRYETGTSMAAPAVSGTIALMQEFFETRLMQGYSPALIKALLINGASPVNSVLYDYQTTNAPNDQGWGVVNITNSIPSNLVTASASPLIFLDQGVTNALATGESQSYILTVPPGSSNQAPLRITLVWTDPPGNPAAALKLVNDLDLVVEEIDSATLQTNAVYVGNSFQPRTSFVDPFPPPTPGTNTLPAPDRVNNVENVYINTPLNDQYRITVKGSRVNVNAVTAHTNNTVQDYALVISVARPSLTTALTVTTVVNPFELLPTQELTNGIPAALQRAGANTPLIGGTNGLTNQWSFYVFTNLLSSNNPAGLTNGTNVAIVTFRSPNLSLPRNREADLDLFVSLNSLITNLDPVVLASPATQRSVGRGGTEAVVVTNAMLGDVYYIAVKSEDQQAAQFNLLAISTDQPFARLDTNGNMILTGVPLGPIPDGDANFPGVATPVLCINNLQSHVLLRAVITNTITHQLLGDVFSSLEFDLQEVVLHPHDLVGDTNSGTIRFIYDDSGQGNIPGSQHTGDGVASLNDFVGMETYLMPFIATFTDNATNHIGSVDQFDMLLERIPDTNNVGRVISLGPSACLFAFIDVPVNATNLIVELSQLTGSLDVFLRRGLPPTMTVFDKMARIFPPGGTLSCNVFSSPPLIVPGRYFIMICNPNPFTVTGFLRFILEYGLTPNNQLTFVATNGPIPLVDDALIYSSILVTNTNSAARIVDVRVGVRADHPRASDLVFHLISPQGTRILLFEERGLDVSTNLGFDFGPMPTNPTPQMLLTNFSWVTFAESTNLAPLPVKFAVPPFQNPNTNPIIFDFTNSFEQPIFGPSIIATNVQGTVFDGWLVETNYVAVIIDTNIALQGSNFLALSHGRVSHPLVTTNDIDYVLNFSYRKVSSATTQLVNVAVPATANMGFYTNSLMSNTLPVAVPKMRLCPGQQCVVTATNCTTSDGINCLGPEGFPISTNINGLPLYGLVGQWCRSAKVFDTNTTWNPPFYIGTNAVLTAPLDPGDYYLFLAENDFDYTDNSGAFTVNVEWQPCQLARFDWDLGGVTNTLFAEEYWKTNSLLFTANPLTTNLGFQSNWNFTVLIDKIELFRPISTIYYQPEEPLALLQNELGVGRWRLEVWDKRVGALPGATNNGQLLSWYLQIQFAPERPATRLTNCVPYSDFVLPNDTRYFVVEVPFEATEATNIFAGPGALDLLYRRDALPTGLGFGPNADPVAYPLPNPFIIFTISPLGAPLIPGGQYFLGVRNTSMTVTNPFTLTVSMNLNLIPLPNNIFTATNGVTNVISSNLNSMPPVTNIVTPGTNMHWYKYTPFADTNSQGVAFDLFSTNGEVRLVAKRAAPVVNYLPTPTNFDYQSVRFTLNSNRITVLTNSFPVRMEPELWLLGVYNVGTNDAAYRLRAYQFTNSMPPNYPAPAPYVSARLSNDTAIPFELLPNNVTNIMMPFSNAIIPRAVIDQTNSAVIFEICNILPMGADVDLLVRRSDHPSHSLYDFADFTQGTSDKFVVLKTNIYIPQLNATNWFLTLINNEPFTVRGTIRFMVATNGFVTNCFGMTNLAPSFIGSGGPFKFSFYTIPGAKYEVQATTDLTSWTPVSTFTATHTTTKFVDPVPGNPNQHRFYRVVRLSP
jgi:subtilisin-like proprotein convertase family protein